MVEARKAAAVAAHERFADLHADTVSRLEAAAADWAEGLSSARTFADTLDAILLEAHTTAVVIGRTHAGDDTPEEEDDRRFAETVVTEEHTYLQGFREALESGRYTGEDGTRDQAAVAQRANLYAQRLTGTANEAWTLALPEDTLLTWHLGASSDSCADCPELAAAGPYTPADLPTVPGKGDTLCGANCRCLVQTASGQRGFVTP
jgi:hypothetical protein